jgi:hypothetical protein
MEDATQLIASGFRIIGSRCLQLDGTAAPRPSARIVADLR